MPPPFPIAQRVWRGAALAYKKRVLGVFDIARFA